MAKIGFNPQAAEKRGCLPAGEYLAVISASDVVAGKKAGSQMLKLTYTCVGEGVKGRLFWQNLNIVNPSAEAQKIAQSELREICEAVGLGAAMVDDSAMLHNKPMLVRIKIEKAEGYDDKNVPTSWKPPGATAGMAAGGFKPPVAGAAAPAAFKPPVRAAAPAPAPFVPPAQAPAQQSLEAAPSAAGPTTTGTTQSPSNEPAEQAPEVEVPAPTAEPAAAPAARATPPWMRKG